MRDYTWCFFLVGNMTISLMLMWMPNLFFFLTNVNAKSLVMEEQHVVEDLKNYKWWLGLRPYQSGDIKEV